MHMSHGDCPLHLRFRCLHLSQARVTFDLRNGRAIDVDRDGDEVHGEVVDMPLDLSY